MADKPIHIAAIDAGSNGIRLVVGELNGDDKLCEVENLRASVRLGADAFGPGKFSEATIRSAVATFEKFAKKLADYNVERIRAVATSAAREADNAQELVDRVRQATRIRLEIIDGIEEAQLIFRSIADNVDLKGRSALLVDMGGGSVEVTIARNGRALGCETLALGCVRLMQQLRAEKLGEKDVVKFIKPHYGEVRDLIRIQLNGKDPDVCFGTGGGVECMARMRVDLLGKLKAGKVKPSDLDSLIEKLAPMSVSERVSKLGLREDRADVIVIAMIVLRQIMTETSIPRILVPEVGLKEGLLAQVAKQAGYRA